MSLEEEIKRTQDVLQPLIDRPQLKDKFLTKPPFRFIHDIVTALIKSTGFPDGLYSGDELDSGNFKDKDAKVAFLTKLIACVGICHGRPMEVREGKVVAGLEPERTNQLLQALAEAAQDKSIDRAEAVRMARAGEPPSADRVPRLGAGAKEDDLPTTSHRQTGDDEAKHAVAEAKVTAPRQPPQSTRGDGQRGRQGLDDDDVMSAKLAEEAQMQGLDQRIEACDGSIQRTRELVEPLLLNKKPKLSDKLLSKPPFRFLHDLLSEIIRSTGFAAGLYNEIESDSSQVVDKEAKVHYLAKMIKLVGMQLNTLIEARPQKIVSGLEATSTNRFLQLLAVAATALPDSSANVRNVVEEFGGGDGGGPVGEPVLREPEEIKDAERDEPPAEKTDEPVAPVEPSSAAAAKDTPATMMVPKQQLSAKEEPHDFPLGAEDFAQPQEKRSMRPITARRRPPRYKERNDEAEAKDSEPKPMKIIVDGALDDDDDQGDDEQPPADNGGALSTADAMAAEVKSQLTRDIQEEERQRLAKKAAAKQREAKHEAPQTSGGIRFGRIDRAVAGTKDRFAVVEADLSELQATIQQLCQSTIPLGKCMDYVHEDLATMNKELGRWQDEFQSQLKIYESEQKETADSLKPLKYKLRELDELIDDEKHRIRAAKNRVTQQEKRINELLFVTCTASF